MHAAVGGLHPHRRWDFAATPAGAVPAAAALPVLPALPQAGDQAGRPGPGDVPVRRRVHRRAEGRATSPTTRRSRSGTRRCRPAIQAIVAAEVGHLDLAYDYFAETALIDIRNLHDNTADGLHIAAAAGAWLVAVAGFGGMRDHAGRLTFAPRLPAELTRLEFRLTFQSRTLLVDVHRPGPGRRRGRLAGGDLPPPGGRSVRDCSPRDAGTPRSQPGRHRPGTTTTQPRSGDTANRQSAPTPYLTRPGADRDVR